MKLFFVILIFLYTTGINICNSQSISPDIQKIVDSIAAYNVMDRMVIRYSGKTTDQWVNFEKLMSTAASTELILLTDHHNAVVRCYSFKALANRENVDLCPIVISHLHDTATITRIEGCFIMDQMVGDYFLEVIFPEVWSGNLSKVTTRQKEIIDSLLIFDKTIQLSGKSDLLHKIRPETKYYDRVREIVEIEKSASGLIALSKYQNPQDKVLIRDKLKSNTDIDQYFGLWAVRNFPDADYFPILEKLHSIEIEKTNKFTIYLIRMLYQAIVQYQDIPSRRLIELTFEKTKKSTFDNHAESIWLALEIYPDKMYDGLQKKAKLSKSKKNDLIFWMKFVDR